MRGVAALGIAAFLPGCEGESGRIEAPAPARELAPVTDTAPEPPAGSIVAPLSVDLGSALAALERIVPGELGDLGTRIPLPLARSRQASFAFEVRREPFEVGFDRDTILFSATLHYRGKAWLKPTIGPELNGECGVDDTPPRARLVLRIVPRLTEEWQLRVAARIADLAALTSTSRDHCVVTFLRVNVTEKVLQAARGALEKRLPAIQERIAALDVRTPLEGIWEELQKPIRLEDSLWLLLQPRSVHLGPLRGSRRSVNADLGVTASPRIVSGPRPSPSPLPLPPLGTDPMEPGFSLPVEGAFDYQVMGARLTDELQGHAIKAAGGEFRVVKALVYGIGGGRVALGIDFDGTARGRVWLLGKPSYDQGTGLVTVPDLDFDARSAGLLMQGVAWLKGDAIREFLRGQARVSAGELLGELQELAVKEMNRSLVPGVDLEATIGASEPAGILVGPEAIVVRARAMGTAKLVIGPEVFEKVRKGR